MQLVEASIAQNANGSRADPVCIRDGDRGRIIPVMQRNDDNLPKGAVSADIISVLHGYAPAVPGLMALAEDQNRTVVDAAFAALLAIGRANGAPRIALELHRMAPDRRRARLGDLAARDAALADRLARLMTNEEIMGVEDADALTDEHPVVRANEDGFEWEALTGPPPPKPAAGAPDSGTRPPGRGEDGAGPGA